MSAVMASNRQCSMGSLRISIKQWPRSKQSPLRRWYTFRFDCVSWTREVWGSSRDKVRSARKYHRELQIYRGNHELKKLGTAERGECFRV